MSDFEEQTINAIRTLFAKVQTLQHINIRDILKPEIYRLYEDTLQQAYDSLTTEDALTAIGMKLEYQHFRLGGVPPDSAATGLQAGHTALQRSEIRACRSRTRAARTPYAC